MGFAELRSSDARVALRTPPLKHRLACSRLLLSCLCSITPLGNSRTLYSDQETRDDRDRSQRRTPLWDLERPALTTEIECYIWLFIVAVNYIKIFSQSVATCTVPGRVSTRNKTITMATYTLSTMQILLTL